MEFPITSEEESPDFIVFSPYHISQSGNTDISKTDPDDNLAVTSSYIHITDDDIALVDASETMQATLPEAPPAILASEVEESRPAPLTTAPTLVNEQRPESQTAPPAPQQPTQQAHPHPHTQLPAGLYYLQLVYRILSLCLFTSLFAWQQTQFQPNWGLECSYDLQVWASVWLGFSMFATWLILVGGYAVRKFRRIRPFLAILQTGIDVFLFCWVLYGIPVVFVWSEKKCNVNAYRWALAGWSYQVITIFLPCVLIAVLVPILLLALRNERFRGWITPYLYGPPPPPTTNQLPTPDEVLKQIEVTTWDKVNAKIKAEEALLQAADKAAGEEGKGAIVSTANGENIPPSGSRITSQENVLASQLSLMQHARPSPLTAAVSQVFTRMASQAHEPENFPVTTPGLVQQASRALSLQRGLSRQKPICPICFVEMEDNAQVMCLPCAPLQHVYHSECLQEWLAKSQHCPMCRANIVELVNAKKTQADHVTVNIDPTQSAPH